MTKNYPVNDDIKALANIFKKNGYCLYIVGGAVRDFLLSRSTSDVDFTTDATPGEMLAMFPHSIKTGIKHGTLTIPFRKNHYEVTTFRIDGDYKDSRHPDKVDFVKDLKADLSRRDFTINAMAADAFTGEIVDVFGGIDDLNSKLVRTVGNAKKRFLEDALRMLRAIRFTTALNFNIDPECFNAIIELSDNIKNISAERIQTEVFKTFSSPYAHRGLLLLHKSRLLYIIDESIEKSYNDIAQPFAYVSMMGAKLEVKLASLFRGDTARARAFLHSLKCSNAIVNYVTTLTDAAGVKYNSKWSDKDVRSFIVELGADKIDDFIALLFTNSSDDKKLEIEFYERIKSNKDTAISFPELNISGNDILALGAKGKEIGIILKKVHEFVLENPDNNKKNILIDFARKLL